MAPPALLKPACRNSSAPTPRVILILLKFETRVLEGWSLLLPGYGYSLWLGEGTSYFSWL